MSKCSSKGGYVVEISTRRENAAVSELANGKDIWLGLSDSQGNQRFDNPMGSPALYSNFAMQEPNVMEPGWPNIYMRGSDSRWIRSAAKEDRFIICEIDGDGVYLVLSLCFVSFYYECFFSGLIAIRVIE